MQIRRQFGQCLEPVTVEKLWMVDRVWSAPRLTISGRGIRRRRCPDRVLYRDVRIGKHAGGAILAHDVRSVEHFGSGGRVLIGRLSSRWQLATGVGLLRRSNRKPQASQDRHAEAERSGHARLASPSYDSDEDAQASHGSIPATAERMGSRAVRVARARRRLRYRRQPKELAVIMIVADQGTVGIANRFNRSTPLVGTGQCHAGKDTRDIISRRQAGRGNAASWVRWRCPAERERSRPQDARRQGTRGCRRPSRSQCGHARRLS
jgi:hypothetical protein